jgi:hypothetical protein
MKSSFQTIYKLTVYMPFDVAPQSYTVSRVKRLRPLHIVALDLAGKTIEIKTTKPMDYMLIRLK